MKCKKKKVEFSDAKLIPTLDRSQNFWAKMIPKYLVWPISEFGPIGLRDGFSVSYNVNRLFELLLV